MVQWAGVAALEYDVSGIVADYGRKRDRLYDGLKGRFEVGKPGGAFYMFPRAPWGDGRGVVAGAIRHNFPILSGGVCRPADTPFRLSYAASDETIDRGIEILNRVAARR